VVWLPPDSWAPLNAAGLAPTDLLLNRVSARFQSNIIAKAGGGWGPQTLTATADVQVRVHTVPLHLSAQLSLPESTAQLKAALDLDEFRPSQLGLTLPGGLTTAAFDFPVSLHASAHARLTGELVDAGAQVRAGSGRLRTPAAFGDLERAGQSFALDAAYDPSRQQAAIKTLRVDAAGIRLSLSDVRSTVTPPHVVTGRLDLEPVALKPLLALWPRASNRSSVARRKRHYARANFSAASSIGRHVESRGAARRSRFRSCAAPPASRKSEATPAGVQARSRSPR